MHNSVTSVSAGEQVIPPRERDRYRDRDRDTEIAGERQRDRATTEFSTFLSECFFWTAIDCQSATKTDLSVGTDRIGFGLRSLSRAAVRETRSHNQTPEMMGVGPRVAGTGGSTCPLIPCMHRDIMCFH